MTPNITPNKNSTRIIKHVSRIIPLFALSGGSSNLIRHRTKASDIANKRGGKKREKEEKEKRVNRDNLSKTTRNFLRATYNVVFV